MIDDVGSPERHRFGPSRYIDDLIVGERLRIPSRTTTEALLATLPLAPGDNGPIRDGRLSCRRHRHRDLVRPRPEDQARRGA